MIKTETLTGKYIRLEALEESHAEGLVRAAAADISLYRWSPVPQGLKEAKKYIQTALDSRAAGSALAFATVRIGMVLLSDPPDSLTSKNGHGQKGMPERTGSFLMHAKLVIPG